MSHLVMKKILSKQEYPTFKSIKDYWSKNVWNYDSEFCRDTLLGRDGKIGVLEEYNGNIFISETEADNTIIRLAQERGIVCQFYGSSDILETNENDKECQVFIKKIKDIHLKIRTLIEKEYIRLSKQKFLTCSECGSKLASAYKVPKSFESSYHLEFNRHSLLREKYSLATDSYWEYEKVPHKLRSLTCPICQKGHLEGITFQQNFETLKTKLVKELEKFYSYRTSKGKIVYWKLYADFYQG